MGKIGDQDGITAGANRLRNLDPGGTKLQKGADGKWPPLSSLTIPIDQWGAWDKWQRSFQILVDDHDAASGGGGGNGPPPIEVTRDLSLVQNILILADDPWPALDSPRHYDIWVTADMGYRHIYEDGSFIAQAKGQGRQVWSWCDCKAVLGNGTAPEVAIQMAHDYALYGAAGEGEHSLAFESGYNAGMRVFVVNMSALTDAQIDLINDDGETVVTAELYWNLQPDKPVDWKNCVGVGSNCAAVYQTSSEVTHPCTTDTYLSNPSTVPQTLCWYCGGTPKPDFSRLP